jgi:hypothetical protein
VGDVLVTAERRSLATAGDIITLEQAARFLTDFLHGDVYYNTRRPLHNLERCRTQVQLLIQLEHHRSDIVDILDALD